MNAINSLMNARNSIIQQNKSLQDVVRDGADVDTAKSADFAGAMREAVHSVNALQQESSAAATAYEMGETTDIAAVMLSKQKATVGFEATLQVRNKLLSAYKDIMNMPV